MKAQETLSLAPHPRWVNLLHLVTVLFVLASFALAAVYAIFVMARPYLGVVIELDDRDRWVVTEVDPGGLGHFSGMRAGDLVIAVNDKSPDEVAGPARQIHHSLVKQVAVLRPQGHVATATIKNTGPGGMPPLTLVEAAAGTLLTLSFFVTALWLVVRRPRQVGPLGLAVVSALLGLVMISNEATGRGVATALQVQWFGGTLASAILFHVSLFFPARTMSVARVSVFAAASYVVSGLVLAALLMTGPSDPSYPSVRHVALLHVVVWCGLAALLMCWSYARPGFRRFKAQTRIVMLVVVLSLVPLLGLSIVPTVAGLSWKLLPQVAALPLAAIPATIGVVASRSALFQFDRLVSRWLVHGTIAGLVVFLYGIVAFVVATVMKERGPGAVAVAIALLSLVLVPALEWLRRRLLRWVDRFIYRIGQDLPAELVQFRGRLGACRSSLEVAQLLPEMVVAVLNLEGAYFIPQPSTGLTSPVWAGGLATGEVQAAGVCRVASGSQVLGTLVLGPKVSGADLTLLERRFVETATAEGAMAFFRFMPPSASGEQGAVRP